MTTLAQTRTGGSTAPTTNELITLGREALDLLHISFGTRKLFRVVDMFKARSPQGDRLLFFLFLAGEAQLSEAQKRAAVIDPDIARVIGYSDPVGEQAVSRVLKQRGF